LFIQTNVLLKKLDLSRALKPQFQLFGKRR